MVQEPPKGESLDARERQAFDKSRLFDATIEALRFGEPILVTESSGSILVTGSSHIVAAESGTTDDLTDIDGWDNSGLQLILRADTGDTITIKHNGGSGVTNIKCFNDADVVLAAGDIALLFYDLLNTEWQVVGAAGGGLDTDTLWAAAGDLVKGTGNDTADILSIGADHTVLVSNGSVPSWSAAPPLANIADTGDTNRITLATSSPHLTITGDMKFPSGGLLALGDSNPAAGTTILISTNITVTGGSTKMINIVPTLTGSASESNLTVTAIIGQAGLIADGGTSGHIVKGLSYQAGASGGALTEGETVTFSEVIAIEAAPFYVNVHSGTSFTLDVTEMYGFKVAPAFSQVLSGSNGTIAALWGMYIGVDTTSLPTITDYIGLDIEDYTAPAGNNYLLEVGPSTPYLRVEGNFTKGANLTPVFISEGNTPTLRQLKTKDGAAITGGDLVCVLV